MSKRVSLRDVASQINYGLTTSATDTKDGPKFLRITDIDKSFIEWESVPHCDATEEQRGKYALQSEDIVVARTGASTGRAQWVQVEAPTVFASYLVRFRISSEYDSRFIGYVLNSRTWKHYVDSVAHGKSAQPNMSASLMADFEFDCPPLSEQRAIAEVLGALDDKIAANNKTIQLADSLTSALAEDAFSRGNFVPLASIAEITMGNSPKGETLNEDGEGLAFFQGIRDFGVRYPQERVSSTAPTRFAKELDTLFSVRAPVGTVNLAGMPCSIGRGISALSSKTETPYALFQAVRASRIWERYNAEGTVFGSINRKQLEQSEIPWVFHSERYELESTLAGLERLLRTATVMNETLSSIRDTLLPQLMSGKLRVQDAETALEGVL